MESAEFKRYKQKAESLEKTIKNFEAEIENAKSKLIKLEKQKENEQKKLQEKQRQFEKLAEQHLRERIRKERTGLKNISKADLEDDEETDNIINGIIASREEIRNECQRIDSESSKAQELIKGLEAKIKKTRSLWEYNFNQAYPECKSTNTDHSYTSSVSFENSYVSSASAGDYLYASSSQNDSLEDVLRRDREARWKHEEEERRREERRLWEEKKNQEAKERADHRKQVWADIKARSEMERSLRHQCNTCSLASKCYMRGSFPCPTYKPR